VSDWRQSPYADWQKRQCVSSLQPLQFNAYVLNSLHDNKCSSIIAAHQGAAAVPAALAYAPKFQLMGS
jgi:hypothetical protein